MAHVIVGKWGKNLAVRFPGEVVKAVGLKDGERLAIEAQEGNIIIRRATPRFTLAELFKGKNAEEWREAYRDAFDWDPDVGREIVEQ